MSERSKGQWKPRIAGTVILYRPDGDVISNMRSYLDDVGVLYAVDNSETVYKDIVEQILQLDKVVYLTNGENLGIARALNIAANRAMEDGYDFLLTMDQDSCAADNMVAAMLTCLQGMDVSGIGILSPFHSVRSGCNPDTDTPCQKMQFVMTSGNLLNLAAYKIVGPFMDKLFIDCVDYDYCLRLICCGFKVIRANRAILNHGLGNISNFKILHKVLTTSNHSPLRRYYNTRNRFYIWETYRTIAVEFVKEDKQRFVGEIRNILLGENERLAKIRMMLRGYLDYRKGNFGRYEE